MHFGKIRIEQASFFPISHQAYLVNGSIEKIHPTNEKYDRIILFLSFGYPISLVHHIHSDYSQSEVVLSQDVPKSKRPRIWRVVYFVSNGVRVRCTIEEFPIIGFYLYQVTSAGQSSNWTTSGIKQHILAVDFTL